LFPEAGASTLDDRSRRLAEGSRQSAAGYGGASSSSTQGKPGSSLLGQSLVRVQAAFYQGAASSAVDVIISVPNRDVADPMLKNAFSLIKAPETAKAIPAAAGQDNQAAKEQVLSLLNHGVPAQARAKTKNTKADDNSVRENHLAELHSRLHYGETKPSSTSLGKGAMLLTDIMAPTSEASHSSNELGFFHSTARKGGAWILKKTAEVVKTSQDYLNRNPDVKESLVIVSQLSGKLQELGFQELDKALGQDPVRGAKDRKEIAHAISQSLALGLSKVTQEARALGLNHEDAAAVATAVSVVVSAVLIKKAGLATIRGAQAATADASKALAAVKKGYQALPELKHSTGGRMLNQYGFISPQGSTLEELVAGKHALKIRDPFKAVPTNQHLKYLQKLEVNLGKEHIDLKAGSGGMHAYENFAKAREAARIRANLGQDAVPFLQEVGPYQYKVYTGMRSSDKSRGWRLDFDPNNPEKGMHINWWYAPDPLRPKLEYRGMLKIDKSTQDIYWEILSHFPRKTEFLPSANNTLFNRLKNERS